LRSRPKLAVINYIKFRNGNRSGAFLHITKVIFANEMGGLLLRQMKSSGTFAAQKTEGDDSRAFFCPFSVSPVAMLRPAFAKT
jgi:hypothetical protein